MNEDEISTGSAASWLGYSDATIRNWIDQDKIHARRGDQPQRPRWYVRVDEEGWPLDQQGRRIPTKSGSTEQQATSALPTSASRMKSVIEICAGRLQRALQESRTVLDSQAGISDGIARIVSEHGEILELLQSVNEVGDGSDR